MFFRDDIALLAPAILIALYQVKVVWNRLPDHNEKDTEIKGSYDTYDHLRLSYFMYTTYFVLLVQLVVPFLSIASGAELLIPLRGIGYLLILSGLITSLNALKHLKQNWSGMVVYRIKHNQELVKTGPYKFIRHPIYSAAIIEIVGFELVANSWLFIPVLIFGLLIVYKHIQKEEALLETKFEAEFKEYKRKTKMFVPYLL